MSGGQKKTSGEKLIATNPIARADFFIEETVEAGLVLTGTEMKSLRQASPNLKDAFVDVYGSKLEAWLLNAHIAPYTHGNLNNHDPGRKRKLLLHRHQIERLKSAIVRDGMTVIPLRMYFKNGRAKLEIGVAKGKKKHDKRQDLKKKTADREIAKAMKQRK